MLMKIVTSGHPYIDIDAYACSIAYAELLNLLGKDAVAASSATWNESITRNIRKWVVSFKTDYEPSSDDNFILVDVSDPKHFDKFVDVSRVIEVIDHHPGLEKHWQELIGDNTDIEFVGAACTLVYEKWLKAGLLEKMSDTSARLLITGILDNTLNFGAHLTTDRDKVAYTDLLRHANLPSDWTTLYFSECQETILEDVGVSIKNDTKMLDFNSLPNTLAFGQLVVWDAKEVIDKHLDIIAKVMKDMKTEWFVNIVSVNESKSYFLADDDEIKKWAENLLSVKFNKSIAHANRLWLRKEVIKQSLMSA